MTMTDVWIDKVRALAPARVELLKLVAESLGNEAIAEKTGVSEPDIDAALRSLVEDLELGPFEAPEDERAALAAIYTEYCKPEDESPDEPAAPAKRERHETNGRKRLSNGGVVVELPPDVIGIDVLTGPVPEEGIETERVSAAIRDRRAQGLKPAFLVLTPSATDPALTNFRMIFFEREKAQ